MLHDSTRTPVPDILCLTRRSVAVVGLGYVGLPTALAFHRAGATVLGLDTSPARLATIHSGDPDLSPADARHLALAREDSDNFRLTDDPGALAEADTIVVCVPTPVDASLTPDLTPLQRACREVVARARPGQTIILTSTSYVGSTRDLVVDPLRERGLQPGDQVHVSFSPERIDPGNLTYQQTAVPRVVSGLTPACAESAAASLGDICGGVCLVSSLEAAELAKLLENTFRAVNISLANEIADAAHHFGLDPIEVITAAATKPFGFMPFFPGPGVGGHCIPCDPHYLLWQLRRERLHPPVISAAMQSIATRPDRIVERAGEVMSQRGRGLGQARVLVVGVTYKPDVADIRESPALVIIEELLRRGAQVSVHDPLVPVVDVAGHRFVSAPALDAGAYDLVLVCCLHSQTDPAGLAAAPVVLDATYRLPAAENRVVP